MLRPLAVIALLVCAAGALPAQAQERGTVLTPKQRERERKAMSAYAATRYQEALDIYADLYADFHDPLYLRNIGRCHQKLRHPDEAIASFEEYLSKYKRLSAAEIEEVQGWIAEMKELQKAMAPPPPPPPEPAPVAAPAPVVAPPPPAPVAAPPPPHVAPPAPPRDEAPRNVGVRRAGIGLLVLGGALAVAGGIFEATSWNKYNSSKNGACLSMAGGCTRAADAIEQRALWSKIFFAGAAATGLTGATLIVLYPVSEPEHPTTVSGLGARAAFSF